jgi:hypothetical protein
MYLLKEDKDKDQTQEDKDKNKTLNPSTQRKGQLPENLHPQSTPEEIPLPPTPGNLFETKLEGVRRHFNVRYSESVLGTDGKPLQYLFGKAELARLREVLLGHPELGAGDFCRGIDVFFDPERSWHYQNGFFRLTDFCRQAEKYILDSQGAKPAKISRKTISPELSDKLNRYYMPWDPRSPSYKFPIPFDVAQMKQNYESAKGPWVPPADYSEK